METSIGQNLLSLRDVAYLYSKSPVLRGVDLDVAAGEVAVLIGRNGAGKSTLLRCAAGWSAPAEGRVEVLGQSLREADRRLRSELVLITDAPPFYDDLTGREHIRFVLRANRLERNLPDAERLLGTFDLWSAAEAYPSTYSRGMRYKLALVMALALRPRLLLLDEPFGPIDPVSARVLWQELRALAAAGGAVLLSSHQLPESADPDRCFLLDQGSVVDCGSWAHLSAGGTTHAEELLRSIIESTGSSRDA